MGQFKRGTTSLISKFIFSALLLTINLGCKAQSHPGGESVIFEARENADGNSISIFRAGQDNPVVVQNAKPGMRPYLHPIVSPDGNGVLTEYSPGHHKHQTGLYWGFTRVNGSGAPADTLKRWFYDRNKPQRIKDQIGRDFFHFNGASHWKKMGSSVIIAQGSKVVWQTVYHMLDDDGRAILEERMQWSLTEQGNRILLDLEWYGSALEDIVINEFSYGGMFLRMPWRKGIEGAAINSSNQTNDLAEGKRAKWVDVGMQIEGRADWGHIAILDHPKNANHPTQWRVDGQLGIGPCRAIAGDWRIQKGKRELIRHRIVAYTGQFNQERLENIWRDFERSE